MNKADQQELLRNENALIDRLVAILFSHAAKPIGIWRARLMGQKELALPAVKAFILWSTETTEYLHDFYRQNVGEAPTKPQAFHPELPAAYTEQQREEDQWVKQEYEDLCMRACALYADRHMQADVLLSKPRIEERDYIAQATDYYRSLCHLAERAAERTQKIGVKQVKAAQKHYVPPKDDGPGASR